MALDLTDVASAIDRLDAKVYRLDQMMHSTAAGGSNIFREIIITDGTVIIKLNTTVPGIDPDVLTLDWGSFNERIYIDAEWDEPVGPVSSYAVEYAKKVAGVYELQNSQLTYGPSTRIEPVEPNTTYGVRVFVQNNAGRFSLTPDWKDITTGQDSSIPAAPTGVVIARGATTVIVKFNRNAETDVDNGHGTYHIQISNDNFATVFAEKWDSANIVAFNDVTAEGTFKARVSAIDSSGNEGPQTTSTPFTAGGIIDAMLVGDFSAAHITFGDMDGDRIRTNTLRAEAIETSSLTTVTITLDGGALRALGAFGGVGLLLNGQGLSLYDTSGVRKVFLDAASGAAQFEGALVAATGTFSGTVMAGTVIGSLIETATSGPRMVLSDISDRLSIKFFPDGSEYASGAVYGWVSGTERVVQIRSPMQDSGYGTAQMYCVGMPAGDSHALLEGNSIYLRKPGPAKAGYIELNADQIQLYFNGQARINRSIGETTTSNGAQSIDGPIMYGNTASGMGGDPDWGMGLRAFADGTSFRIDTYWMLNALQGLTTSGSKTFQIDHPVLGYKHYLTYSSVESPRADLSYRGLVTLNSKGEAVVDIDKAYGLTKGTFEALHFQEGRQKFLFSEGGKRPPVGELLGSKLMINGEPGDVVGWLVYAERGDASMLGMQTTDSQGHIVNERKKTKWEIETDHKHSGPTLGPKPVDPTPSSSS